MLVTLDKSMLNAIIDNMNKTIASHGHYVEIKRFINQSKSSSKNNLLQLFKKLKSIIVRILCNISLFAQNNHFIDTNTLAQTTYYKTLTSRP